MPGLNINLLSVSKLEDHNIFIRGRLGGIDLVLNRETISTATRTGGSYALDLYKETAYASQKASRKAPKTRKSQKSTYAVKGDKIIQDTDSWVLWHHRLAHVGRDLMERTYQVADGIPQIKTPPKKQQKACDSCQKAKQVRIVSRDRPEPAKEKAERMGLDIWGPYSIPAFGFQDAIYFFTYTCEKTRHKWVRLLRSKDQLANEFLQLKTDVELRTGYKIKFVRMDGAGENITLGKMLHSYGITIEYTTAYTPSQNGIAERLNHTLIQMAKAMLFQANLP
jgi:hypothetical protein